jgi:hypothetical protein
VLVVGSIIVEGERHVFIATVRSCVEPPRLLPLSSTLLLSWSIAWLQWLKSLLLPGLGLLSCVLRSLSRARLLALAATEFVIIFIAVERPLWLLWIRYWGGSVVLTCLRKIHFLFLCASDL